MRLGMIGCGNMAAAMIKGILDKGLALPEEIPVSYTHLTLPTN